MSLGFSKSGVDPNLYYHIVCDECLILVMYIDELFLTSSERLIVEYKQALIFFFEMKDLSMLHYFLGLEVWWRTYGIFLSQGKYTVEIFEMMDCKSMLTPMMMNLKKMNEASSDLDDIDPHVYRQLIGSLMYLVNTRSDICYEVNVLSQFMSLTRQTHWITAKHVLRYLRGRVGYVLIYGSSVEFSVQGYANTNWAGSAVDWKNTSSCCFTLGSTMVSWCNGKEISVVLSTIEEEYIALSVAVTYPLPKSDFSGFPPNQNPRITYGGLARASSFSFPAPL